MIRGSSVRLTSWSLPGLVRVPLLAAADFRDDYKRGIEALERGEWIQATALFRQAAAERPDEKARLSRSPFSRRYLPQFFLGQALLGMGDCEGAVAAWTESEKQGVISRLPEYQALTEGRDICRLQLASRSDAERQAESEIANAESASQRLDRLRGDLGPDWTGTGTSLSRRFDGAERRLLAARQQLADSVAAEDVDGMQQAASMALEARGLLEGVERDAIRLQGQLRLEQGALLSDVGRLREQAEEQLEAAVTLRPYPRRLGRLVTEVSTLVDDSQRAELGQDSDRLRELRGELEDALARLREAAAPPPEALSAAARAFFDGDYEAALELLDGLDSASRRVALEAHILRAATNFTLYQLRATGDDELLESARSEVMACLEIDRAKRPPAGPFSPRFIEFFESQAASDAEGSTVAERQALDASDRVED